MITSYLVTSTPGNFTSLVTGAPPATSTVVYGLTNGTSYTFTVYAQNSVGAGPNSAASNAIIPTPGVPAPPTILSGSPGNTQATITFQPGIDCGSAITNYSYSTNGGAVFTPFGTPQTTSPLTISNLTNGTTYTILIKAINGVGTSVASNSIQVTPSATPCFLENTKILCLTPSGGEEYVAIQEIRKGTKVKTLRNGYVPVHMIATSKIYNSGDNLRSKNRLYKCTTLAYPEVRDDLVMTGCHAILVDTLTQPQKELTHELMGNIFVTDSKYRLIACVDERAVPYEKEGTFDIYHLALDANDIYINYGIWANGLLVETCSKRYLKDLSGMTPL